MTTNARFNKCYTMGYYLFEHGKYSADANLSYIKNSTAKKEALAVTNCWKESPEQLAYWQNFFAKKYAGRNIDIDRLDHLN